MLILLICLGFFLPRMIPGSPLQFTEGDINVQNLRISSENFSYFEDYYAPSENIFFQFRSYIEQLRSGDWGYSFHYGLPVRNVIFSRLGFTFFLSFTSIIIGVIVALPLGISIGFKENKFKNNFLLLALIILQTIPAFLVAVIFQMIFAHHLNIFPAFGAYPPGTILQETRSLAIFMQHAILPISIISIVTIAPLAILTRNIINKVKKKNYVETAYYLGIKESRIKRNYIFLNSLPEIVGRLNIIFIYAITGSIFVEIVFSYPGMGQLIQTAVDSRDYPLIQGIFLVISLYSISVNLIFKLIQNYINPRLASENE